MKKEKRVPEDSILRQKAEAIIKKLDSRKAMLLDARHQQNINEADTQKLVHELQVHQIELEMQNAELQDALEKAANAIALYDFAPTGYFTINPDSTISKLNISGAKMLGKERLNLIKCRLDQFITTDTEHTFHEFLQKCFETSSKQICEIGLAIPGKPHSFLYLEGMVTENKQQCLVVAVDITERKHSEEAIRASQEMYRLLVLNLPKTSLFLFDNNLRFILAEGYLHPDLGYTTTNMEGKTLWELLPPERASLLAPIYKNALEGKPTENFISEYKDSCFSVNILPVKNKQGEIIAGMVVSQDITTRKQAEDELKSNYSLLRIAGETAKFGGWFLNLTDNKVTWSDEVAIIHEMPAGYSPSLDEGIYFYAPEWREKISQAITDCTNEGIPFDEEMELITAKSNRIWVRAIGEAVRNENGKIIKVQGAFQDVTERKLAEQALLESEEKWRKLVYTIPDYVALYDRDGKYLFLNRFAEGFSMKDIEGKTFTDFLPDVSKPIYEQAFKIAKQTNTTQYVEHTALSDNRSLGYYESFFVPIFENDEFVNMMVIARNITARKQAENELAQDKALIDAIFNSIPGLIYLYDLEGNLVRWNKKHEIMTGYTAEELSHFKLLDWYKGDEESQAAVNEGVKETISKGFGTAEANLQRKDGTPIPMYFTASPLTINGKEYFTGIGIDMTARKLTEEELKTSREIFNQFLENSPIYIFFKDENIRSLRLSRNYEKMLGKPLDELIGKSMDELFPSDLAKIMVEKDIQILKKGEEIRVEEEFNGRFYSTIKFPIQIEGKPTFLAGFTIDITEQKAGEQVLQEREDSLRELNATKDKFFSIIAHDLKSPFNSILGFSSILARQIQERDYGAIEQYADIIQNSSQQAMDLLMNLLEWSRSQTGRMVFNPERIDIVNLINQSTELFSASAQQKSISVYSEIPVKLDVFADKAMISTILRNLISNAIKFTDTGGKITISTKQMPDELMVSVLDNGVGMSSESIGKLFRIEENYSTLGTQKEKGTGLGLLLCKEFIEKHGGRIWVESEPGKGSRFFFSIPNGNFN